MGWVWKDDSDGVNQLHNSSPRSSSDIQCSSGRIVRSRCKTEEVEPDKFIRKCEKTEELLKDCVGWPSEVVQSEKEYTEEDVTDQQKANLDFAMWTAVSWTTPVISVRGSGVHHCVNNLSPLGLGYVGATFSSFLLAYGLSLEQLREDIWGERRI